jgi:hypothetical protein
MRIDDPFIRQLIDDFVLRDKRLGERIDRQRLVSAIEEYAVSPDRVLDIFRRQRIPLVVGSVALYGMVVSFVLQNDLRIRFLVCAFLMRLRQDRLSLDREAFASNIGVPTDSLRDWELGRSDTPPPDGSMLYRWLRAIGLVCPPKTALVYCTDISSAVLKVLQENPEELKHLPPDQFEAFVANRLDRMGFNVKLVGPTNRKDGGIDIIAVPKVLNVGSFVLAAQVKHHAGDQKTGRDAVDRLASWNGPFRLGMLVTNTAFTKDAVWAAAQDRNKDFIRLRDFNGLKLWLQDQYGTEDDWRSIPDVIELAPGISIEVPKPRLFGPDGDLAKGYR